MKKIRNNLKNKKGYTWMEGLNLFNISILSKLKYFISIPSNTQGGCIFVEIGKWF